MSSDLLAEFDTFYRAPQDGKSNPTPAPALNDLSFLNDSNGNGQTGDYRQWQNPQPLAWGSTPGSQTSTKIPAEAHDDIWGSFEAAADTSNSQSNRMVELASAYGRPAFPGNIQSGMAH